MGLERQNAADMSEQTTSEKSVESEEQLTREFFAYYKELERLRAELAEKKGESGIAMIEEQIKAGAGVERVVHRAGLIENFAITRNKALEELEKMGFFTNSPEGLIVCDIEKVKEEFSDKLFAQIGGVYNSRHYGQGSLNKTLFLLFEDFQVVDRNDYKAGARKTKPLFYYPRSKEDALDVGKIKNSDFYLSLYDLPTKRSYRDTQYGGIKDLDFREVILPLLVYHPNYLNGYRDESGNLMVKDAGEYRKFSGNFFSDQYSNFGNSNKVGESLHTPKIFSKRHLPHLIEKGLLTPDDFEIMTSSVSADSERVRKKIKKRGTTMFDNVHYTLGSEFDPSKGNYYAYKIAKDLGGVIVADSEDKKQLLATFKLYEKEEARQSKQGYFMVGRNEANVKKYDTKDVFSKKADETKEEYQNRLKEYESLNNIMALSDCMAREAKINLTNFSHKEQQMIAAAATRMDYQNNRRFVNFAIKFGEQGLKTLVAQEYGENSGEKIAEMSELLAPAESYKIFEMYKNIYDKANNLDKSFRNSEFLLRCGINSEIRTMLRDNFTEALLRRATDILSCACQIAKNKKAEAVFYNGAAIQVDGLNEVYEAFAIYQDFLSKLESLFAARGGYRFDSGGTQAIGELSIYEFIVTKLKDGSKSYASINIRSAGTNNHLKGVEYDGEARINFLFHHEPIPQDLSRESRKQALTFRLDRECLVFDDKGEKVIARDNIARDGRLSLDFGSIYKDSGYANHALGRVVAAGNFFASAERRKKPEFYHNKESFYRELGQADAFKEIAEALKKFLEQKYAVNHSVA